jgi:anti-sigma factor RsiW
VTCREVADFIADYLSGELSECERRQFEEHLRLCPNCVEYVALYRTTITLGRHAFDDTDAIAGGVPDALVDAILAARKSERSTG